MLSASEWVAQHFGTVELGDIRLQARAQQLALALIAHPADSLPRLLASPAALKAAYRFLHRGAVTRVALSQPHWQHTRQAAQERPRTLFISDLTTLDYSAHRATTGLGEVGTGQERGYFVQTTLAVDPAQAEVLGVAYQQAYVRQPTGLSRDQRRRRHILESVVWNQAVKEIGNPLLVSTGCMWGIARPISGTSLSMVWRSLPTLLFGSTMGIVGWRWPRGSSGRWARCWTTCPG